MTTPELQAANSLLKRGLRYKIPAPLFLRLFGKRQIKITITQLYAGTELRVAAIIAEAGITDESLNTATPDKFMVEHYKNILHIVAIASLNRRVVTPLALYFRRLALKRLSVWQLFELYVAIRQYSGVSPFMTITRLAVETRMTKPNLGQAATGS